MCFSMLLFSWFIFITLYPNKKLPHQTIRKFFVILFHLTCCKNYRQNAESGKAGTEYQEKQICGRCLLVKFRRHIGIDVKLTIIPHGGKPKVACHAFLLVIRNTVKGVFPHGII